MYLPRHISYSAKLVPSGFSISVPKNGCIFCTTDAKPNIFHVTAGSPLQTQQEGALKTDQDVKNMSVHKP